MKPIRQSVEALQSNTGQFAVGMPDVPNPLNILDVRFDNTPFAVVAVGAVATGVVLAVRHQRTTLDLQEDVRYPAGSDMAEKTQSSIRRGRRAGIAMGVLLTGAVAGSALDAAEPHTSETVNNIKTLAAVIDSGFAGHARNVEDKDSEDGNASPIEGAVNGFNLLSLDGIDTTVIAAGANPQVMGTIRNGSVQDKNDIVESFVEYASGPTQRGSEQSGGGDIKTALSIAEAINPDKVIVVTGSLADSSQSPLLQGQNEEGVRDVSVIALGTPGSTVKFLGVEYDVPIEPAVNERIVGSEDSYSATSVDEFTEIIQSIIDEQYTTTEKSRYELFAKLRNVFIGGTLALGSAMFYRAGTIDKTVKRNSRKNK